MFRDLTRIALHETGEKKNSFVLIEKKANRKQKICVQQNVNAKRLLTLATSSLRFLVKQKFRSLTTLNFKPFSVYLKR